MKRVRLPEQNSKFEIQEEKTLESSPVIKQITAWLRHSGTQSRISFLIRTLSVVSLFLMITIPAGAKPKKEPATASDIGYVFALSTGNRFLLAWQSGDLANGMVLLSDGIRRAESADKLEEFFSADSDRGFEIGAGRGNRGRYTFPVVLLTVRAGHTSRRSSFMILMLTGKNDWVVDKLP